MKKDQFPRVPYGSTVHGEEEINAMLGDLENRVEQVRRLPWGGCTNVERAFDEILKACKDNRLPAQQVANFRLCIFSDMEFDQAKGGSTKWTTMHEHLTKKFKKAGYPVMPTIIYWNLRASVSMPIKDTNTPGVSLLSGFSAGLMRKFLSGQLEADEEQEEVRVMDDGTEIKVKGKVPRLETILKIVEGDMYDNLLVADEDLQLD